MVATIIVIVGFVFFLRPPSARAIYQRNIRSIVELKASKEQVGESFGTAEFIDDDGTLITNAHVVTYSRLAAVYEFDEYFIRFADEDEYRKVELVKYDIQLDIAVLRLVDTSCQFDVMEIGVSASLKSGDTVYAMGNMVNYGLSISQGIVGIPLLKMEYSDSIREVIQCDLTIAEGNSGGALLNERGKLVGITTFRTKDNSGDVVYGIAYSIPIYIAMQYVKG